jgi:opacity protein-like surface antigen
VTKSRFARLLLLLSLPLLFLAPSVASAQRYDPSRGYRGGTIEISGFGGWFFGGSFPAGSNSLFNNKVDINDEAIYGGRVGWNITDVFEPEVFYSRTQTHFLSTRNDVLLAPSGTNLGDLTIDYALGLMTFNFGKWRWVPYMSVGMGAAHLSPDVCRVRNLPCANPNGDWRYTMTVGGGLKTFFTEHFGVRFDGRYYGTLLDSDHQDCNDGHCHSHHHDDWMSNGDVTGGLVLAF